MQGPGMAASTSADNVLDAISRWLQPVLTRESIETVKALSVIDRLASADSSGGSPQAEVVRKALAFLWQLHTAFSDEPAASTSAPRLSQVTNYLYDPRHRRLIYALFDLISLEGIYPSLSPGVGVPVERRVKSVLPPGVVAKPVDSGVLSEQDRLLLGEIVECLYHIYKDKRQGLQPVLQERTLVDLISACGQLSFGPHSEPYSGASINKVTYNDILDETDAPTLFPILISLLHPATPTWLRPHLSGPLSLLPLRPNGVRQTIEFIAIASPQPEVEPSASSQGPALPLEALTQASKLFASIPANLSPEEWFTGIAPQLFDLLDGKGGPELSKTSGFIIGSILGRKRFGAPGTVGYRTFVESLHNQINPPETLGEKRREVRLDDVVVQDVELELALNRLQGIVLSHPNPGLTQRLLRSLMLSLWGIGCYARKIGRNSWKERALTLLQTYLKVTSGVSRVIELAEKLRWNGDTNWTYGPGSSGGIEIRQRPGPASNETNIIELMADIDNRVDDFMDLLSSGVTDDAGVGSVFLAISRRWLLQPSGNEHVKDRLEIGRQDEVHDPMGMLVNAKITQKMLGNFKEMITSSSTQIFELVKQILERFIKEEGLEELRKKAMATPSYSSLANIVESDSMKSSNGHGSGATANTEVVSIVLSLLSSVITTPGSSISEEDTVSLMGIQNLLKQVYSVESGNASEDAQAIKMTARNLDSLISLLVEAPEETRDNPRAHDPQIEEDRKAQRLALSYLTDELPPVRAQGLSILTSLINSRSSVLDIPATVILLVGMLQDEDEYIYLTVVRSFAALAENHSRTTIRMLVERYIDSAEELSLDQRLRIGEALLRSIEKLGIALVEERARTVGEAMIGLAGHRGKRLKTWDDRRKKLLKVEKRNKEAAEAWGGAIPQLDEDEGDQVNERLSKIIEGWQGREGGEDVRIRASALSILSKAVETNIAGLGSAIVSTAVDLAISILTMEKDEDTAILRRAAALLIFDVIKAMDQADREGKRLNFGFAGENLADIIRVLRYVQEIDTDEMVRGHAGVVIEGLEMWQSKSLLGFAAMQPDLTPRFDLGTQIAGLSVNPEPTPSVRPKIEELE